jgi:hypothetical protein
MKRVWSDSKFPPEKVKKRDIEIYSNRRGISKNCESCTKSAKFNTNGDKNM